VNQPYHSPAKARASLGVSMMPSPLRFVGLALPGSSRPAGVTTTRPSFGEFGRGYH
jgi:hypothetical protein